MGRGNFDNSGATVSAALATAIFIPIIPAAEAARARLWGVITGRLGQHTHFVGNDGTGRWFDVVGTITSTRGTRRPGV